MWDSLFGLQMNTNDNIKIVCKIYQQYWLLFTLNKSVIQKFGKINILLEMQQNTLTLFFYFGSKSKLQNKEKKLQSNTNPLVF